MNVFLLIAFTCVSLPLLSADHDSKRTETIAKLDDLLNQGTEYLTVTDTLNLTTQINLRAVIVDSTGKQCLGFGSTHAQKGIKGENNFHFFNLDTLISEPSHPQLSLIVKQAFFNKNRTLALLIPTSGTNDTSAQSERKNQCNPIAQAWQSHQEISSFTINTVTTGDDTITCLGTHSTNKNWTKCIITLLENGTTSVDYQ